MIITSKITKNLKQSGIRSASTRCEAIKGINLGQGICDLRIPNEIKRAAYEAIENNKNIYSACEGFFPLRAAIAKKMQAFNQIIADPMTNIVVTHGSTGAFVCTVNTLFNPDDEVILFEPFYSYHRNILELKNINVKIVPIQFTDLSLDIDLLKKAITSKTRGIVICTPCNPSGKVFSRDELLTIGRLASQFNLFVITDEIYEYITYPGYTHVSLASLENFKDFTVTISGFSKTYNMTGWRLGYAVGPSAIMHKIALVQDLLYVCPVTPLQHAMLAAFELDEDYYTSMTLSYLLKRNRVVSELKEIGFDVTTPQGAYYLLADFSRLNFATDDEDAAKKLLEQAKVATVPGRSFYKNPKDGKSILRFCYALDESKIEQALAAMKMGMAEVSN
ncbi:MAG TPA: pyridoxal phosphate-dependent aminotransferase [Gammaproteobacteria bacterium]|nr:pyridoxal phosphate-dependent aminotransferase [Gammaproteobacteria bacterium]